jgi:hypothetical protein
MGLTGISTRLPAAPADTLTDTALRSVGRLDVLSSTPAAASVARPGVLLYESVSFRVFRCGQSGRQCNLTPSSCHRWRCPWGNRCCFISVVNFMSPVVRSLRLPPRARAIRTQVDCYDLNKRTESAAGLQNVRSGLRRHCESRMKLRFE